VAANQQLSPSDFLDFNDQAKLGGGKELVDRLTSLIAIFEKPALNFARNRADDDDILGDAYEYLMRHFAIDSGKSKGQFLTPAEVSRVKAQLAQKPKVCLDYVLLHELCHLRVPRHGEAFVALLNQHMADWQERKRLLNRLPIVPLDLKAIRPPTHKAMY
jgi:hypothetical protein